MELWMTYIIEPNWFQMLGTVKHCMKTTEMDRSANWQFNVCCAGNNKEIQRNQPSVLSVVLEKIKQGL